MNTIIVLIFAVWLVLAGAPGAHAGPEQRCSDLGAICRCARSLAATGWHQSGIPGNSYSKFWAEDGQDVNDPKLCGNVTSAGERAIVLNGSGNPGDGVPSVVPGLGGFNAVRLTGLTLDLFPDNFSQWSITFSGRLCSRYYFRLNSGYISTDVHNPRFPSCGFPAGTGLCEVITNDKYTEFGQYFTANTDHFYWNGNTGQLNFGLAPADVIGHWIRMESCVHLDPTQPQQGAPNGWIGPHSIYFTDLTTGISHQALNLDDDGGFTHGWGIAAYSGGCTVDPCDGFHNIIHRYRAQGQDNGSGPPFPGTSDMMFGMMAFWPVDQGQTIGAAVEIEGGQTPPTAPTAPSNLRFTDLLAPVILAGAILARRIGTRR